MANNTLTGLIPTLYESLDIVSREMVGFIPAVTHNASADRAALNQSILVPIAPPTTLTDNTPGVTSPDLGDQTIGNVPMLISKSKSASIRWNGEQQLGMKTAGTYGSLLANQFAQAFRALTNQIEIDLWTAAYQGASRAYGTAGTAPFGTAGDLSDVAQIRKILDDNGTPQSDLQLVLVSSAVANLRGKQTILLKVNEAGSSALLRSGSISDVPLEGFALHNSNAISPVIAGTGASYVTSGSTAIGTNGIALVTGTGTVNPGDVVTFAADTVNKYVVNAGVSAPGTITIGAPGALKTIATANAMTIGAGYTANVGFSRSAMQLITRPPATVLDMNGKSADMAEDMMLLTDPYSGITYEVSLYPQYRQMLIQVSLAWGVANIKPNHTAILMG
jgi:hypothetical protein